MWFTKDYGIGDAAAMLRAEMPRKACSRQEGGPRRILG